MRNILLSSFYKYPCLSSYLIAEISRNDDHESSGFYVLVGGSNGYSSGILDALVEEGGDGRMSRIGGESILKFFSDAILVQT